MMMRWIVLLPLLVGCSGVVADGPPGPQGPAGPPGADGADGEDAVASGERLTARFLLADDGSRLPLGDFADTERGEVCAFREYKGEWLCLPRPEDATEWFVWVKSDCTGDRGYVDNFKGSQVVRVLSNDPSYLHTILVRAEEVPGLFYKGPTNSDACQVAQGAAFQPPFHRWAEASAEHFVGGTIAP